MMFSVIIPLYNKVGYINKAIKSVLNQTCQNFELIIVNDGSTDNSLEIVQAICGSTNQQVSIINQTNSGVSSARNNGVKTAKHNYIAFLDADDWWENNFLEEMQKLISRFSDSGIWAPKYYKVKFGKNIEANIGVESSFTEGYINYFNVYAKTMWMPITSSSVVIRKDVFYEFNGFKTKLKLGEDFDLWVRIALKYKIAYLNKPLVYYNQDVDIENRAVNSEKYYKPENNFIFQLDYLENEENRNQNLKQLLDNLRVYGLYKYHIFNKYPTETQTEISKVNFNNQPLSTKIKYRLSVKILVLYYYSRKYASVIKSYVIKIRRKIK